MKRGEYHTALSGSMVATIWRDTKVVSLVQFTWYQQRWKKEKVWYRRSNQFSTCSGLQCQHHPWVQSMSLTSCGRVMLLTESQDDGGGAFKLLQNPPNVNQKPLSQVELRSQVVKGLVETFSCRKRPGPPNPRFALSVVRVSGQESVNIVSLGIRKRGRCEQCCIGVSGTKQKETLALAVDNVTSASVILNVMMSIIVFCMKTISEI